MTFRDGDRVSFIGHTEGLALGDQGKVLSANAGSSHVQWTTGARRSQVDLVLDDDLVKVSRTKAATVASAMDDSLAFGSMVTVAVRETLEEQGEAGLLNALNETGHLAGFSRIAEDALDFVAGRLRADEAFSEVLGHLEPEEASGLVSLASSVLMRDAFGSSMEGEED